MNQAVATKNAPAAIGPYSQGVKAGKTIYVSGQIPIDPATGELDRSRSIRPRESSRDRILRPRPARASPILKISLRKRERICLTW